MPTCAWLSVLLQHSWCCTPSLHLLGLPFCCSVSPPCCATMCVRRTCLKMHWLPPPAAYPLQYIRKTDLTLQVLAGVPNQAGYNGDDQLATSAFLNAPTWLVVRGREVYFSDSASNRVRKVDTATGIITVRSLGT